MFCLALKDKNMSVLSVMAHKLSSVFPDIAPMYFNLFALLRECDQTWFPPNHVFKASPSASENLQFRLR